MFDVALNSLDKWLDRNGLLVWAGVAVAIMLVTIIAVLYV